MYVDEFFDDELDGRAAVLATGRMKEMHITLGQMLCAAIERALGLA
jgi:hypothetical protein